MLRILLLISMTCISFQATSVEKTRDDYMIEFKVQGSYGDIRDDVEFAITSTGIKINTIAHTGDMLKRTGKDLGSSKEIFKHAEAFEFCSAALSRATMEVDPRNFIFCPYIIYVYQLPKEKNIVYVAYRRPNYVAAKKSEATLKAIDKLLNDIILDAIN